MVKLLDILDACMQPLYREIAQKLEQQIRSGSIRRLPSRANLARIYGVSEGTVRKALQELNRSALIRSAKGRRPEVIDGEPVSETALLSDGGRERLEHDIRKAIITGQYRAGRPLRKIEFYADRYGLSRPTVIRVLRTLAGEGHVHKKGKSYLVGTPQPGSYSRPEPYSKATILILMAGRRTWHRLRVLRTEKFVLSFENEAYLQGVELKPVFLEKAVSGSPVGFRETAALVRNLKSRYLGTLVPLQNDELSGFETWIRQLHSFSRPIIWFDRHGISLPEELRTRSILKCRFSEDAGLHTALDHLKAFGHSRILYTCRELDHWAVRRGEKLREIARRKKPSMNVELHIQRYDDALRCMEYFRKRFDHFRHSGSQEMQVQLARFELEAPHWRDLLFDAFEATYSVGNNLFDLVARLVGPDSTERIQPLYGQTALLLRFGHILDLCHTLQERKSTALLIDSDTRCHDLLKGFRFAGIRVPEELSLLSFDNYQPFLTNAVSSVDFGFGSMGYWAYHALIGDITVPFEKNGTIRHSTHVNNYGTVGSPNRELLLKRLELVFERENQMD